MGTPATVRGVADVVVEYPPVPAAFTAATRNMYALPFVSPVTAAVGCVDVPSANVFQFNPASELTWIT